MGLAIEKITGLSAIDFTISSFTMFGAETPINTSAPFIASASEPVFLSRFVIVAIYLCTSLKLSSPSQIIPLISQSIILFAPILKRCFVIAIPAEPAPFTTMLAVSIFLPTILRAFKRPAATITAVPCWSSWKTGMSHFSFNFCSISKHLGAAMSSRLIPPNEPLIR